MDATEAGSGRPVSSVTGQTDAKGIPPDYDVWSVLLDGTLVCTREESSGCKSGRYILIRVQCSPNPTLCQYGSP